MGGFDGEVETTQGSAYIPKGKCILQFGTNKDFKTKAEGDYTTRSENDYEGLNKSETTFLFMTPRCWGNKKDWEEEKKKSIKIWFKSSVDTALKFSAKISNQQRNRQKNAISRVIFGTFQ